MPKMDSARLAMAVIVVAELLVIGALGCEGVRDAADLTVELERRYPNTEIEIRDLRESGAHTVEVKIVAPSFEDANLAEDAREIAESIQQRYELGEGDTVAVEFQVERQTGALGVRKGASFTFPVSEIAGAD